MYFTEGDLLMYEKMMREVPPGGKIPALSSSTLASWPLAGGHERRKDTAEKEEAQDECGQ